MLGLPALVLALSAACSGGAPAVPRRPPADAPAAVAPPAPSATLAVEPETAASDPETAPPEEAAPTPPDPRAVRRCVDGPGVALFVSPRSPAAGRPVRVMAVSEQPLVGALVLTSTTGERVASAAPRRGGPPYWWHVELAAPAAGAYRAVLGTGGTVAACKEVRVGPFPRRRRAPRPTEAWRTTAAWGRDTENLYAAWIERLFDAPLDEQPSWHALHEITRDPARNFLHDHLALGEDAPGSSLALVPDCADLPFYLRAYFAWKLGLPFGWSDCTRGGDGEPPRCVGWHDNADPPPAGPGVGELARMERFLRVGVGWGIHSGAARADAHDDGTALYPIRLTAEALRPGVVYADPYGHTLMIVRRVPQTPGSAGLMLAVDAQPDGTVARKRYWRGNFLFADDPALGSPGFKRFRPIVRVRFHPRPLRNAEIAAHPAWGDFSLEQTTLSTEAFYDRVDALLSPSPMDPVLAFRSLLDALDEQVRTRVRSVQNGEEFVAASPGTIAMPRGAAIFETRGAWEDYATPSRDLRLLIAIDIVRGFPQRVAANLARYAVQPGRGQVEVRDALLALLREETGRRRVEYRRTDGTPWTLTLAEVMTRAAALEMAYNPNDCVETRWGAPEGSDEARTCRRRAPDEQRGLMSRYRAWFHERRRPPRESPRPARRAAPSGDGDGDDDAW